MTTIFGHRGIPEKYIENSLDGFEYTAKYGEAVEFDVQLTKDMQAIIMHDEKIDRTSNGKGYIKDYTLDQLRTFKLVPDVKRPNQLQNQQLVIPTLAEVLAIFKQSPVQLNIELKTDKLDYPGIEAITLDMVKSYGLTEQTIFSSFRLSTMQRLKGLDQQLSLALIRRKPILCPQHFMHKHQLNALHIKQRFKHSNCASMERLWTVNDISTIEATVLSGYAGLFTDDFELAMQIRDAIKKT